MNAGPPPPGRPEALLSTSEPGQAKSALPGDQGFQAEPHEGGLPIDSRESGRTAQELVVEIHRGTLMDDDAGSMHTRQAPGGGDPGESAPAPADRQGEEVVAPTGFEPVSQG